MNSRNHSITIILLGFAALFSSIKMREKRDLPILTQNHYSMIFGFIVFIVVTIDYVKHSKYMKN